MPTTFTNHYFLAVFSNFSNDFISVNVNSTSTYRYFQCNIFTTFTSTVATAAILATFSAVKTLETIIDQCI